MSDKPPTTLPAEPGSVQTDPLARDLPTRRQILREWLVGQPLVPPAVGLVLGIALDATWPVPFRLATGLFVVAGVIILLVRHRDGLRHVALLLAALALGTVLHDQAFRRWPADHVVRYCGADATGVRLTGTVVAAPAIRSGLSGHVSWFGALPDTRLLVAAEKIEGVSGDIPVSGTVAVRVGEPVLHVTAGDRVELFGTMYHPFPPANPGSKDWALAARREGILVEMSCDHAANVVVQATGSRSHRWLAMLRRRAGAAMLDQTFPGDEPGSRLLSAMVLGQRSAVDAKLNDLFVRAGTVHYLSVSGAHVGMLMSAVWLMGWLAGASRRACALWAMLAVTGYAVVAEPRPPILRSMIMADLFCLAILLRRPVRSANWLALAAIVLLILKPTQLFSPGFQLSFITVAAIIYLSPVVHDTGRRLFYRLLRRDDPLLMPEMQRRFTQPSKWRRAGGWVASILGWWLALTVSAWLVSLPLGAYHFQRVVFSGWFSNFLVYPLIWSTEVLGLAKTILTAIWPPVAGVLGVPLAGLTNALIAFVGLLARLPGAGMPTPAVPGWLTVAGVAVLGLWVAAPPWRIRPRWVAAAAFAFAALAAWRLAPAGRPDTLRIDVLSVGKGSACVIGLPNGNTLIYDIGSLPPYDLERWTVGPLLALRRIYHIDAVVLSHPNLDHFSGLGELLDRRAVKTVIAAPHFEHLSDPDEADASGRLLADVRRRGTPWRTVVRGDGLPDTGEVEIEVLWPPPLHELSITRPNDTSIVLRITFAGCRVLLCGDIEELAQRELLATADLKADVLVLPHHGSVGGSTRAFLEAVDPAYCIRSSDQRNVDTDNGLLELVAGREYFNTADDGAVEVRITPSGLSVRAWRPRRE